MSNICTTNIDIYDTEDNIKKLADAFEQVMDDDWLGNLLPYIEHDDYLNTHGHIICIHADKTKLSLTTQTEYSPQFRAIRLFVETVTKTAKILFTGDEPLALGHVSNDPKVLKRHPDWFAEFEDFDL